jgi:hypothetical protein
VKSEKNGQLKQVIIAHKATETSRGRYKATGGFVKLLQQNLMYGFHPHLTREGGFQR